MSARPLTQREAHARNPHFASALEILAESTRTDLTSVPLTPAECAALVHDRDLARIELDATRAQLAETLAALDRIAKIAHHLEADGWPVLSNADRWRIVAECREQFAAARPENKTRLVSDTGWQQVKP